VQQGDKARTKVTRGKTKEIFFRDFSLQKKLEKNPLTILRQSIFSLYLTAFSRLKVTRCAKKNKTNTKDKNHVADKTIQDAASYGKLARR